MVEMGRLCEEQYQSHGVDWRVKRVGGGQGEVEEYCGQGRAEALYHWTAPLRKRSEEENLIIYFFHNTTELF